MLWRLQLWLPWSTGICSAGMRQNGLCSHQTPNLQAEPGSVQRSCSYTPGSVTRQGEGWSLSLKLQTAGHEWYVIFDFFLSVRTVAVKKAFIFPYSKIFLIWMSSYPFDVTFAKPLNEVIRKSSLNQYNCTEQKTEQSTYNKKGVWALFIDHRFEI